MQHCWPAEAISGGRPDPWGSRKTLNIGTLYIKWRFLLHCQGKSLKGWLLRFGCYFFSTWHWIKHSSICTTGQVLITKKIYTFVEGGFVDIVRLLDVRIDKGYMYCTLYFFTRNKIATVSQILNPDKHVIWSIMENEVYDEIMSRRLWR